MNLKDYRKHLQTTKRRILDELPKIADEIAVSTLSLVKDRSINEGIIIEGKEGTKKEYSDNKIPTKFFKGKELNGRGSAYITANALGTWGAFRRAQGLPSDKVNLGYTMRMWTNIQVIRAISNGEGKITIVVGGSDTETREKITQNVERYGMFFDPTPDELALAQDVARDRINKLIKG